MDDLIWGLILGGIAYFIAAHWDDIISAVKSFFFNLADELGIDIYDLIDSFKSTITRARDGAYYLVTEVFLRDRYGRKLQIEPKVVQIEYKEIPERLKSKVQNGHEVDATTEVRKELVNQLQ